MSRIAKIPIIVPVNVDVKINGQNIFIQGKNGNLTYTIHSIVNVQYIDNKLILSWCAGYSNGSALAGTTRAFLNNMIIGVTDGFFKKLQLIGVGYRVEVKVNVVSLWLGFSHVIHHQLPLGVTAQCLNQTEITLRGANKQVVGQVAADICSYSRAEPYKGKGIRYADKFVRIKEAKKK